MNEVQTTRYLLAIEAYRNLQVSQITSAQTNLVNSFRQKLKQSAAVTRQHEHFKKECKHNRKVIKGLKETENHHDDAEIAPASKEPQQDINLKEVEITRASQTNGQINGSYGVQKRSFSKKHQDLLDEDTTKNASTVGKRKPRLVCDRLIKDGIERSGSGKVKNFQKDGLQRSKFKRSITWANKASVSTKFERFNGSESRNFRAKTCGHLRREINTVEKLNENDELELSEGVTQDESDENRKSFLMKSWIESIHKDLALVRPPKDEVPRSTRPPVERNDRKTRRSSRRIQRSISVGRLENLFRNIAVSVKDKNISKMDSASLYSKSASLVCKTNSYQPWNLRDSRNSKLKPTLML